MGQFKPMVKMMTTEPSIELKLKKGGHVAMPKMKSKDESGHKKMAMGGMPPAMDRAGLPPGPVGGAAPAAPSMAMRRKAMKMRRPMKDGGSALEKHADMPASKAHKGLKTGGVAMGQGGYKDGGSVIPVSASKKGAEGYTETKMHTAKPDRSPAKTGDVKMGNGGGYKKGGLAGYAKGGGVEGNVSSSSPGVTNTKTGEVRKGNAGGFKKGGALKKFAEGGVLEEMKDVFVQGGKKVGEDIQRIAGTAKGKQLDAEAKAREEKRLRGPDLDKVYEKYLQQQEAGRYKKGGTPKKFARGGSVNDSGKAEKMPQGYKKPPTPVSINQLSGTYKKGGKVKKYAEGGVSDKEQAQAYNRFYADEKAENEADREAMLNALKNPLDAIKSLPERLKKGYEAVKQGLKGSGSVTTTEREVSRTVTPTKKRYGGAC